MKCDHSHFQNSTVWLDKQMINLATAFEKEKHDPQVRTMSSAYAVC
jgi:hypothetical protein